MSDEYNPNENELTVPETTGLPESEVPMQSGQDAVTPSKDSPFRLREVHGEVYLPEFAPVEPDTPDFAVELGRCLPPGVAETVAQMRRQGRRGYRRIELLAILLLLAIAAGFIYWYFPAPLPSVPFQFEWNFSGSRFVPQGEYAATYRAAQKDFEAERYDAVVQRLEPVVRELVTSGKFTGNDEIFYLFFTACGRNLGEWGGGAQTLLAWQWAETADAVADADPDQLQWRYQSIWLRRRILGDYEDFYRDLKNGLYRVTWNEVNRQVQRALRQLRDLRGKLATRRNLPFSEEEVTKQLDLLEAEFLTFAWMLEGGRGSAYFPDDEGGAGVVDREAALALIRRYEAEPDARQFLALHRFLLETVIAQGDSYFNALFWDGERVYFMKPLLEELNMVRGRLMTAKGGGR